MSNATKQDTIDKVNQIIIDNHFLVYETDFTRPWGAFFRLDNSEAERFIDTYFADIKDSFKTLENLSPKFLILEPSKRFSWQYHSRRAEIWRVIEGAGSVQLSDNDIVPDESKALNKGDMVRFPILQRHRLTAVDDWLVVVEIWQHTDRNNLSDESDIVRVQDDFGR